MKLKKKSTNTVHYLNLKRKFESAREASKWVEFVREIDYCHHDYIKLVCKGKHKTCFGYHWEFADKKEKEVINEI